eukprot:jgi/Psemu1/17830/gm1.17830_g
MKAKVLLRDLPSLGPTISTIGEIVLALAAAVTALTDQQLQISEEREQLNDLPDNTTIKEVWGSWYTERLKNTPEDLPPSTMLGQVDTTVAEELGIFPPLVTMAALKPLQRGRWNPPSGLSNGKAHWGSLAPVWRGDSALQDDPEPSQPKSWAVAKLHHIHPYPRERLDHHHIEYISLLPTRPQLEGIHLNATRQGEPSPPGGATASCHIPPSQPVPETGRIAAALIRGPHKFSHQGIDFLWEEYANMMDKQQWTVLPAHLIKDLPELSP